jgi:hypothetical protein
MFDKIEWVSTTERKPSGYIIVDPETGYKEPAEYLVHIKGAAYPTFANYVDGRFVPCYGSKHIAFYGEIEYWAEIPRWKH